MITILSAPRNPVAAQAFAHLLAAGYEAAWPFNQESSEAMEKEGIDLAKSITSFAHMSRLLNNPKFVAYSNALDILIRDAKAVVIVEALPPGMAHFYGIVARWNRPLLVITHGPIAVNPMRLFKHTTIIEPSKVAEILMEDGILP